MQLSGCLFISMTEGKRDRDVMALSFRVSRLQFNGANANASPDTSTPPWPSISRGASRERERERERGERGKDKVRESDLD